MERRERELPAPDLGPVTAARIETWCRAYQIPAATFQALRAAGKGPVLFSIGRAWYCRRVDWMVWLEEIATVGGTDGLSPVLRPYDGVDG